LITSAIFKESQKFNDKQKIINSQFQKARIFLIFSSKRATKKAAVNLPAA